MECRGSGRTYEFKLRVYKNMYMCVKLEWVAGSRWTAEGLDGLVNVY